MVTDCDYASAHTPFGFVATCPTGVGVGGDGGRGILPWELDHGVPTRCRPSLCRILHLLRRGELIVLAASFTAYWMSMRSTARYLSLA